MIYESGEMYLETILVLHKHHEIVRAIDVANERKYSKPSVSRAINVLSKRII
jgi:Mn-dependent DtxR family transcriptional regulator